MILYKNKEWENDVLILLLISSNCSRKKLKEDLYKLNILVYLY